MPEEQKNLELSPVLLLAWACSQFTVSNTPPPAVGEVTLAGTAVLCLS